MSETLASRIDTSAPSNQTFSPVIIPLYPIIIGWEKLGAANTNRFGQAGGGPGSSWRTRLRNCRVRSF